MSDNEQSASNSRPIVSQNLEWPIGSAPLPNPTVQLFFWGIMGFRYDSVTHECEIGFHHGSPTHSVKILVLEDLSTVVYSSQDESPKGLPTQLKIEFEVGTRPRDVTFLQEAGPLDRTNSALKPNDFRWLVDFEHPDFYGFQLPMNPRVFRKRLFVRNGVFYSLPTCATFDVVGGPHPQEKIHIARYVSANLNLAAKECISLKLDGTEKLPPQRVCGGSGKTYQFFFVNNCDNEEASHQSDFYLNFDVVAIPHDERFELVLKKPPCPDPADPIQEMFLKMGPSALSIVTKYFPFNTDEAPCMGAGYGSGGSMPPFPPG